MKPYTFHPEADEEFLAALAHYAEKSQTLGRRYYQPVPRGLELKIGEKLKYLAALDQQSPRQRSKS